MAFRLFVAVAFVAALFTFPYALTLVFPDDRNDFAALVEEF